MDIIQLAKEVERKRDEYQNAVRALAEALGPLAFQPLDPPAPVVRQEAHHEPQAAPQFRTYRKGPTASQRVLEAIQKAPAGLPRSALIQAVGNPGAVHSALKKHKAAGLVESVDGVWRAVREDQRPK
jgi:hypothetical protein